MFYSDLGARLRVGLLCRLGSIGGGGRDMQGSPDGVKSEDFLTTWADAVVLDADGKRIPTVCAVVAGVRQRRSETAAGAGLQPSHWFLTRE